MVPGLPGPLLCVAVVLASRVCPSLDGWIPLPAVSRPTLACRSTLRPAGLPGASSVERMLLEALDARSTVDWLVLACFLGVPDCDRGGRWALRSSALSAPASLHWPSRGNRAWEGYAGLRRTLAPLDRCIEDVKNGAPSLPRENEARVPSRGPGLLGRGAPTVGRALRSPARCSGRSRALCRCAPRLSRSTRLGRSLSGRVLLSWEAPMSRGMPPCLLVRSVGIA